MTIFLDGETGNDGVLDEMLLPNHNLILWASRFRVEKCHLKMFSSHQLISISLPLPIFCKYICIYMEFYLRVCILKGLYLGHESKDILG